MVNFDANITSYSEHSYIIILDTNALINYLIYFNTSDQTEFFRIPYFVKPLGSYLIKHETEIGILPIVFKEIEDNIEHAIFNIYKKSNKTALRNSRRKLYAMYEKYNVTNLDITTIEEIINDVIAMYDDIWKADLDSKIRLLVKWLSEKSINIGNKNSFKAFIRWLKEQSKILAISDPVTSAIYARCAEEFYNNRKKNNFDIVTICENICIDMKLPISHVNNFIVQYVQQLKPPKGNDNEILALCTILRDMYDKIILLTGDSDFTVFTEEILEKFKVNVVNSRSPESMDISK